MEELVNNRYKILNKIDEGSNSIVYKALDTKENLPVALKIMSRQLRDAESILRFNKEIEVMSKLRHPNIVRLLEVGEHHGASYLVMELIEGKSLHQLTENKKLPLASVLNIIKKVAEALVYVHDQGIIHRDLKPGNILIQNSEVKVIDFCLARIMNLEDVMGKNVIVGTFSYMSPEQGGMLPTLPDERSDLYSLGVIFYELLTGELPFKGEDVGSLLRQHMTMQPQSPKEINPEIPGVVHEIVLKLLKKRPEDRYQSAKGLLADMERVRRLLDENRGEEIFSLGSEDSASLSYYTRMAGRKEELAQLREGLKLTIEGKGLLSVVSGTAGMGKTRLIDELRPYAEKMNAVFISGKCNKYGATLPYSPFIEAITEYVNIIMRKPAQEKIRHITRIKETLGELGGAISRIVPALSELIGEQPLLLPLELEKEKIRFFSVILSFFLGMANEKNPMIVFLDDLQWTDIGTLELLRFMLPKMSSSFIYILASYRLDEVNETHRLISFLKDMKESDVSFREVILKPLAREDIIQIIQDSFAYKEEVPQDLIGVIEEYAKGNPFYTLQMLRSLVDQKILYLEKASWLFSPTRLKEVQIPQTLVELLLERIKSMKPGVVDILSYASVIGRDFNYELLLSISGKSTKEILEALDEGLYHVFICRKPGLFRGIYTFSHDKIWEALYEKTDIDFRKKLHEEIAEYLEESHKDKTEIIIYELAHHYYNGLNMDKALDYTVKAGEKATTTYAHEEVLRFFGRALDMLYKKGEVEGSKLWLKLKDGIGDSNYLIGKYDDSIACYGDMEVFARTDLERAKLLEKKGRALWGKGELVRSAQYYEEGLKELNIRLPKSSLGVVFLLLRQLMIQIGHSFFPFVYTRYKAKSDPVAGQKVDLLIRLSYFLYFADTVKLLAVHFLTLNNVEHMGPCKKLSQVYADHGVAMTSIPLWKRSFKYLLRALKIGEEINDAWSVAHVQSFLGMVYYWHTEWDRAIEWLSLAIESLNRLGDRWQYVVAGHIMGRAYLLKSDFRQALKFLRASYDAACSTNDVGNMGGSLYPICQVLVLMGEIEEAEKNIIKAINYNKKANNVLVEVAALGVYAQILTEKGDLEGAIEQARQSKLLVEKNHFRNDFAVLTYPVLADALLRRAEKTDSLDKRENLLKEARGACRKALSLTRFLKNYQGYAYRVNGTYECLRGNYKRGQKYFIKSIKVLENQGNKFELARTYAEAGRRRRN